MTHERARSQHVLTNDARGGLAVASGGAASAVADPAEVFVESAIQRIAEMTHLPAGWDGEDAHPPTGPSVAQACRLIVAVAERSRRAGRPGGGPWTSAPIADGGLQVEWLGPGARIEVQAGPDGSLGYLIKRGEGAAARYEEADGLSFEATVETIMRLAAS
jgi:hypothetical protein